MPDGERPPDPAEVQEELLASLDELRASEDALRGLNAELEQRVRERTADAEAQRARLEAVLEQLPVGVAVVGARTREILLTSREVDRILGPSAAAAAEWTPTAAALEGVVV